MFQEKHRYFKGPSRQKKTFRDHHFGDLGTIEKGMAYIIKS